MPAAAFEALHGGTQTPMLDHTIAPPGRKQTAAAASRLARPVAWAAGLLLALALVAAAACAAEAEPTPTPQPPAAATAQPPQQPAAATAQPPQPQPTEASMTPKQYDSPPAMAIDTAKSYTATIELAKGGEIVIELYADKAPVTVNSFVFLAREGYYDGVTFHRVIPNFMAQTGDPTGTGMGGPGYRFDNELHPDLRHDSPGIVSMANSGVRNGSGTNGSQIFLTFVPTPFLDGFNPDGSEKDCSVESCHAVFGKVVEGMDVLLGVSERDPQRARTPGDAIRSITINEQ